VPNAPGFELLRNADFAVFDRQRGMQYLGSEPVLEFMFPVGETVHEAPVYVPELNNLYLSNLPHIIEDNTQAPEGYLDQLVVDLDSEPPTLGPFSPKPAIFAPNGGTFHNGLIYWTCSGAFNDVDGAGERRISLNSIDPTTNESTVLINNYFGYYFNNMNDAVFHPTSGDIFFTDAYYPWLNGRSDTAPQLPTATYRWNPKTGAIFVVDDTLEQPNGIAFTPDGNTLYIADSGALGGSIDPNVQAGTKTYNTTGTRTIYAFDVSSNGTKITNKRSFYLAHDYIPDGVKVSSEGLVLTASGQGIDIIDEVGQLLIRVQTNHTVNNLVFTGPDLNTIWLVGGTGISRARMNITGQTLR
jgi:sugar lactone lactonase YvrE